MRSRRPDGRGQGNQRRSVGDCSASGAVQVGPGAFQKDNAGVTTDLQFADLASYLDRVTTQAASKSLPDVLWMRDERIGLYGSSGALLDLSPYLSKGIDTSKLSSAALADGKVGNGIFALPSHYVGQAVITNAPYLQDKGINYEQ